MSGGALQGLARKEEILAALRSRAYWLLCGALGQPDDALHAAIRSGELAGALREVLEAIHPLLGPEVDWQALGDDAGSKEDLAVEHARLFDVGPAGPPCPLYGGLYAGERMKAMEEAVRFYDHFGLSLSESPRELPDHLTTELEFLHYLASREAEALQSGGDPGPFRRAQRDFVRRHPGRWVPKLRQRLEAQEPAPFFREVVALLDRLLAAEGSRLAAELPTRAAS